MKYDYSKLRGRMVEKCHSVSGFAAEIGIAVQTITSKLTGKREITKRDIVTWSKALDIPNGEIGEYFFTLKV